MKKAKLMHEHADILVSEEMSNTFLNSLQYGKKIQTVLLLYANVHFILVIFGLGTYNPNICEKWIVQYRSSSHLVGIKMLIFNT